MAAPMGARSFLQALRDEGLTVVEVGDWEDHNRNHKGAWGPVHGVMIHHTVTKGSARTVEICRKGYAGLPGPLCHGVITKDGKVHLVGYGRANHAGSGDDDVLQAVIGERTLPTDNEANTDGNRHFYGFECENLGDGEDPWPEVQLEAIERAAAAVCRHHGWDEESVIGHLEWQPGKVDPRGFTMASMRARVHDRLKRPAGADTTPPKEALVADKNDVKVLAKTDGVFDSPDKTKDNPHWTLESYQRYDYLQNRETLKLVRGFNTKLDAQQKVLDKLVDAVAAGANANLDELKQEIRDTLAEAVVKVDVEVTGGTPGTE